MSSRLILSFVVALLCTTWAAGAQAATPDAAAAQPANTAPSIEADPISPMMQPHAQAACDPCGMAFFCFNTVTGACNAYTDASRRGKGLESIAGGVLFAGGGALLGAGIGALIGYITGVLFFAPQQFYGLDFFHPQAVAGGTIGAVGFAGVFAVIMAGSGLVYGMQQGPQLLDFDGEEEPAPRRERRPRPPAKQDEGGGSGDPDDFDEGTDPPAKRRLDSGVARPSVPAVAMGF